MIRGPKTKPCEERRKKLGMVNLEERRPRGGHTQEGQEGFSVMPKRIST